MQTVRGTSRSRARALRGRMGGLLGFAAMTAALGPALTSAAVRTVEKCDGHPEGADAPAGGLPGQLRRLLNDAASGDLILVPAGCTVTLLPAADVLDDANLEGDLDLTRDVSIQGAGPGRSVIDGSGGIDNVFEILSPARASLSGLTIRGAGLRGIRHASGGLLTVSQAIVEDSELEGIVTVGPLALSQATLRGNRRGGLDIDADEGTRTVVLTNVTVTGNTSFNVGGVRVRKGTALLNHVTITGNHATAEDSFLGISGGLYSQTIDGLTLRNTLIAGNTRGSGTPLDCNASSGVFVSLGSNLVQDADHCAGLLASDLTGVAPLLGPLAANGGATPTHALLPGSPAIDAGDGGCAPVDQRGVPRSQGGRCDIGAFEAGAGSAGAFPDLDGDGRADLVVVAGPGGPGEVRVLSGATGALLLAVAPFDPQAPGPLTVAACDLTGDGRPDLIAGGTGPGGPEVRAVDAGTGAPLPGPLGALPAFGPLPGGGRAAVGAPAVACADVDGDGVPDVIAGAPAGAPEGPVVRVFSGVDGSLLREVPAFDPGPRGVAVGP